jgi:ABC-type cobalamin/Fe3+-siderophores transport system ATPase subunit
VGTGLRPVRAGRSSAVDDGMDAASVCFLSGKLCDVMDIDVTLKGYRCFAPDSPATIQFRGDIVALVGVNNSGKSTLLKAFYELRPTLVAITSDPDFQSGAIMANAGLNLPAEVGDPSEIFWHFGTTDIEVDITLPELRDKKPPGSNWRATIAISREQKRVSFALFDLDGNAVPRGGAWRFQGLGAISKDGFNLGSFGEMYSALRLLSQCFYYPSIRHVTDFKPDGNSSKYYDVLTGKPFIDNWALMQLAQGKESTERMDAVVEDVRRIFRFDKLTIQSDYNRKGLLVVSNGKSSRLSELGTGLAQFVLLLGNVGFSPCSYILIDEPETNLHPSLQLDFLNAIAARASEGVIFATHNLGLARQAADRIFAFTPSATGCTMSAFHKTENLAHLIGELSFGRSDFAPARKLMLVEGQTDVLTFQNLLAAYGREHEFAIVSLGGQDGINSGRGSELEHMQALGIDVVAIIDSERAAQSANLPSHRKEFVAACQKLGYGAKCWEGGQ